MYDLLLTPDDFRTHLKRATSSASSIVIYGNRAPSFESFWGSVSPFLSVLSKLR